MSNQFPCREPVDVLDALLNEALHQASHRTVKKLPGKDDRLKQIRESFQSTYVKPENWERTRGIALIHRSPDGKQTLLGNFSEYVHKNGKARKLLREAIPMIVEAQEFVTGEWWLRSDTAMRIEDHNNFCIKETCLDLELGDLQVFAHRVMVKVHMHDNWIARVELAEQTKFVCPLNSQFLHLSKGLDVLDGLSFDSKMELRKQMGV